MAVVRSGFWLVLTVLLGLWARPSDVSAQGCCTPGSSPLGGITGGAVYRGSLEFGGSLDGFELDQGYEGTQKFDDPRYSRVLSSTFYARVGLSNRFVAIVELPLDNRMRRQDIAGPSGTKTYEFNNTSIGDVSTLFMARIWPWAGLGRTSFYVGGGMKWPTGRDDAMQDGLRIPFELQVGTGTYDPVAVLSVSTLFDWGAALAVATTRFPTRATSGYRYGEELNVAAQVDWYLGDWRVGPQVRSRFGATHDFNSREVINTGGHRLMLGGQVSRELARLGVILQAAWVGPVWQDLTGRQLGVTHEFVFSVQWKVK